MNANEITYFYNQLNNIILSNKYPEIVTDEDPSTRSETTSKTDTDSPSNNLQNRFKLNFSIGKSNFLINTYLSNKQLQQARESIRKDMNT